MSYIYSTNACWESGIICGWVARWQM